MQAESTVKSSQVKDCTSLDAGGLLRYCMCAPRTARPPKQLIVIGYKMVNISDRP